MISVTIFRGSDSGSYKGVELSGHAGYGEHGQDIVCAAVSALVLNTANSVEALTEDGFSGEMPEEGGSFSFHFTGTVSSESRLLMDSLILGLQNIKETYGAQYIKIRFKEV